MNWPAFVRDGNNLLPVLGLFAYLLLQVSRGLQNLISRSVKRFQPSSFSHQIPLLLLLRSPLQLSWLHNIVFVILLGNTYSAKSKSFVESLCSEHLTEGRGRALVGVGGQDEGDEIKRIAGGESGKASKYQ